MTTNFLLAGSITIGSNVITLPGGSGWTADIDEVAGTVANGTVIIPGIVTEPVPNVPITMTITDVTPASGTIDAGGDIDLAATLQISIEIPALQATCVVGPIAMALSTTGPNGSPLSGTPATATTSTSTTAAPTTTAKATAAQATTATPALTG